MTAEDTRTTLTDSDIETVWRDDDPIVASTLPGDADGTDGDATDGDADDADGSDGDASDATDGDADDADGQDA